MQRNAAHRLIPTFATLSIWIKLLTPSIADAILITLFGVGEFVTILTYHKNKTTEKTK